MVKSVIVNIEAAIEKAMAKMDAPHGSSN